MSEFKRQELYKAHCLNFVHVCIYVSLKNTEQQTVIASWLYAFEEAGIKKTLKNHVRHCGRKRSASVMYIHLTPASVGKLVKTMGKYICLLFACSSQ